MKQELALTFSKALSYLVEALFNLVPLALCLDMDLVWIQNCNFWQKKTPSFTHFISSLWTKILIWFQSGLCCLTSYLNGRCFGACLSHAKKENWTKVMNIESHTKMTIHWWHFYPLNISLLIEIYLTLPFKTSREI